MLISSFGILQWQKHTENAVKKKKFKYKFDWQTRQFISINVKKMHDGTLESNMISGNSRVE